MASTSVTRSPQKPDFPKPRIGETLTPSRSADESHHDSQPNRALLIEQARLVDGLKPLLEYAYHTNDWVEDLNSAIVVWQDDAMDLLEDLRDAHEMQARAELESLVDGWTQAVFVSHVRKLPAEILTEIFLLADGDDPYEVFNTSPGRGPNRFAQVCRRWRSVALNYTPLWARLHVKISRATKLSEGTLAHLQRVMTLSRNRLIDVQFDMGLDVGSLDLAASHLWALTSHCGRWQKVQLSMPTLLVNDLNDHILDNVSALTNITLVNVDDGSWDWEADDLPRMHFLENAPLLRHVSVCDFSHSRLVPLYDTHIVAFPFHKSNTQLHSFSVYGGSAWHAVDCLMSQPSLRHLSVLKNDCGMDSLSLPLGPISKHSSLSSISTSSSALLDTVGLPNLRSASLDVASDWMAPNQDRLFDSLVELLARSHAKLEGLTVTDLPLSPHVGFIPMLTGLTSLTSISLKFTRYARQRDTELRYLTECLLEKDFLPRLACIEIGFSYLFYPVPALKALNKVQFFEMLRIRCSEGALRRLKLTSSREPLMSEEQQESVKKLVKYGLTTDIRLKSGRL